MALVTKRTLAQTGFPASRQPQHGRAPAWGVYPRLSDRIHCCGP
jgi:hypothetical protein